MSLFSVLIEFGWIPSGSIRSGFLLQVCRFPSGGTGFPRNSPFTPVWDDLPLRSASGTHRASLMTTPWSGCPTRSPPCGSLLEQSLYLLPSPGSSGISFGCAWSWSGRSRSSQGGWHFHCRNESGIPLVGFLTHGWSFSSRLLPCRLLQPPCSLLPWLIVP